MTLPAIEVTGLSKKYIINHQLQKNDGLRHIMQRGLTKPFRWAKNGFRSTSTTIEEFWALKDLSFSIQPGEVVGVVGRNGAGKSTLLKVLSRITEQTQGRIHLRGRTASLLEVGTGFHPELTGRENIYLNGAILGMGRNEIKSKFDEIVDFAEVEKFLDTPVKRYSSGMYVRLAFGVAAHLDPEILIVDEVLAVGDAEFQRKCLGKMNQAAQHGRTVLFVSHNMATVQSLCTRAIYLKNGTLVMDGTVDETLAEYSAAAAGIVESAPLADREDREGGDEFRIQAIELVDSQSKRSLQSVTTGQDVMIKLHYINKTHKQLDNVVASFGFFDPTGAPLFDASSDFSAQTYDVDPGEGVMTCRIPSLPLAAGPYTINVRIHRNNKVLDWVADAEMVSVESGDFYGHGKVPEKTKFGVLVDYQWLSPQNENELEPSLSTRDRV